jgi:protocatechuate 3,4-dioxygenase beta subunit
MRRNLSPLQKWIIVSTVSLILPLTTLSQAQPGGTVIGTVTEDGSNQGVGNASVEISNTQSRFKTATDSQGRFRFEQIPPGRYMVRAEKEGFFPVQARPTRMAEAAAKIVSPLVREQIMNSVSQGVAVTVTSGQTATANFVLVQGSAIVGQCLDTESRPLVSATISILKITYVEGERVLALASRVQTDDRGQYRVFGLSPGDYYLKVELANAPPRYFPDALDLTAAHALNIGGKAEIRADIQVSREPLFKVSGKILGEESVRGIPLKYYVVRRGQTAWDTFVEPLPNLAGSLSQEKFEIEVASGSYDLVALPGGKVSEGYFVVPSCCEVRGINIEGVTAKFLKNDQLMGRLRFQSLNLGNSITVRLQPEQLVSSILAVNDPLKALGFQATVDATGRFVFPSLPQGRYKISFPALPGNTYVVAVSRGSQDITREGGRLDFKPDTGELLVDLRTSNAEVVGRVRDVGGKPVAGTVTLAPLQDNTFRFKRTYSSADGGFSFSGVPPGEYRVFAWGWVIPAGADMNPEFLLKYESLAERVVVEDNRRKDLQLRAIPR